MTAQLPRVVFGAVGSIQSSLTTLASSGARGLSSLWSVGSGLLYPIQGVKDVMSFFSSTYHNQLGSAASALQTIVKVTGAGEQHWLNWANAVKQGKVTADAMRDSIMEVGKQAGQSSTMIAQATKGVNALVTGASAGSIAMSVFKTGVIGLAGAFNLLLSAMGIVSAVLTVGMSLYSWYKSSEQSQAELESGLTAFNSNIEKSKVEAEAFSKALDKMKDSSDALGNSLGHSSDQLTKFFTNDAVRDRLAEQIAVTTQRADLISLPQIERESKIKDELGEFQNYFAREQAEYQKRVLNGSNEKRRPVHDYLMDFFGITKQESRSLIDQTWDTLVAGAGSELVESIRQVDEAFQSLKTSMADYQASLAVREEQVLGKDDEATTSDGKILSEEISGSRPLYMQ